MNVVNVCHHACRECDCMASMDWIVAVPISVHSAYYFMEDDYVHMLNCFGPYTMTAALHVPEIGKVLPASKPEFQFVTPQIIPELFTYAERSRDWFLRTFAHDSMMAMMPLGPAGTTYIHPAMSWLKHGGLHTSPFTRLIQRWVHGHPCALLLCLLVLVVVWGFAGHIVITKSYWWYVRSHYTMFERLVSALFERQPNVATRLVLGSVAVVGVMLEAFVAAVIVRVLMLRTRHPGLITDATISFVHATQLPDENNDPVVDIFHITVGNPRDLAPVNFANVLVQPQVFAHAVAMFAAGGVPDVVAGRAFSSGMRRFRTTPEVTAATVKQARQAYERLNLHAPMMMSGSPPRRWFRGFRSSLLSALALLVRLSCTVALVCAFLVPWVVIVWTASTGVPGWWA